MKNKWLKQGIKIKTEKPKHGPLILFGGTCRGIEPVFQLHYTRKVKITWAMVNDGDTTWSSKKIDSNEK